MEMTSQNRLQKNTPRLKKDDYYLAEDDNGIEFTVDIDDTFNNLDFEANVGTDYRVFTDEKDADKYFAYLKSKMNV